MNVSRTPAVTAWVACLTALSCHGHGAAAGNLLAGGDFESVPVGCGTACHSSCLPGVPGWRTIGSYWVDRLAHDPTCPTNQFGPWKPALPLGDSGGVAMLSLQGSVCCGCNNNGWIEQTVDTVPGRMYRLSLDVALDRSDVLRVTAGTSEMLLMGSVETEASGWRHEAWIFIPTGQTTVVRLASESPSPSTPNPHGGCWEGDGCLIDNITLEIVVTCVDADLSPDGQVSGADLGVLLGQWGTAAEGTAADIDGSGTVDGTDLGILLGYWGPCD
jgi:hypothetical protein